MLTRRRTAVFSFSIAFGFAASASAYVGPAAGLSVIGAIGGLVLALLATLGFFLTWPIKRLLAKRKNGNREKAASVETASASPVQQDS